MLGAQFGAPQAAQLTSLWARELYPLNIFISLLKGGGCRGCKLIPRGFNPPGPSAFLFSLDWRA